MEIEHNSQTDFYRHPFGAVTCGKEIRLRLNVSDAGIPVAVRCVYIEDWEGCEENRVNMPYSFSMQNSSIYEVTIKVPERTGLIWYYFELETHGGTVYYGNNAEDLGGIGEMYLHKPDKSFQITVYDENFTVPEWFGEGIAYQIFPDRFKNGNANGEFLGDRKDIIKRNWDEQPYYRADQFGGEYKANDFFGGNLDGIIEKLPYLHDLGITVIYMNPIFRAYSNHKYDTGNYDEIDPMFGDTETFRRLCERARELGIRIILDGVFNHTGSDSLYFNKDGKYDSVGAYQSKESRYYPWFCFTNWPDNYESWWGMNTLPQVNEKCDDLRDYILSNGDSVVKRWIKCGASGWRLDVADELPDFFLEELRRNVKEQQEDAVIIGEVWEDASKKIAYGKRRAYFSGAELDSVMNYLMRTALINAVMCREDAAMLNRRLMSIKENYPQCAYHALLNIISSHDVERILTVTSGAPGRNDVNKDFQASYRIPADKFDNARKKAVLVMAMQMTLPGVPCVYYGDEVGMQGYGDPFCRAAYPWEHIKETDPDGFMMNAYKKFISIRKSSEAFTKGDFVSLYTEGNIYAYIRFYKNEKYIIVVNMGNNFTKIRLDAARFCVHRLCCMTSEEDVIGSGDGIFLIDIPGCSVKVYDTRRNDT